MEVVYGHNPTGGSVKMLTHYLQEIHANGNFQQYDFGKTENMKRYGRSTPPSYPVEKITVPVHLFYGKNDWLAMPKVEILFKVFFLFFYSHFSAFLRMSNCLHPS